MAFIPDNAFKQRFADKIPAILWEFYEYLCIKRNHETRLCNGTVDEFVAMYGYKRASKFNLLKLLKNNSWVIGEDGKYFLLVGDFSVIDARADERRARREQSKKIDSTDEQSKKIDDSGENSPKKWTEKSKKIDSHIKESLPAVRTSSKNQQTHTERVRDVFADGDDDFPPNPMQTRANEILDGLKERFKVRILPNEADWLKQIEWAIVEQLDAQFLPCFDFLKNQHWRKGRLKPQTVAENLIEFEDLEAKEQQERANATSNGNIRQFPTKPSSGELIENRDYGSYFGRSG